MNRNRLAGKSSALPLLRAKISAWCIVGTSIPGRFGLVHPADELQRIEAGRTEDTAASRQACQHGRHQTVNMKEWHDVEATVRRPELERPYDICR